MVVPKKSRNLVQTKLSFAVNQKCAPSLAFVNQDPQERLEPSPPLLPPTAPEEPRTTADVLQHAGPTVPTDDIERVPRLASQPRVKPIAWSLPRAGLCDRDWLMQSIEARTDFEAMCGRLALRSKSGRAGKLPKALLDVGLCTIAFHKKWFKNA